LQNFNVRDRDHDMRDVRVIVTQLESWPWRVAMLLMGGLGAVLAMAIAMKARG
jgi:hypothetical protein